MTEIDKLVRVKKGDKPSASQHNLIVEALRGGQGLKPGSIISGGKVYSRNKGFPAPVIGEHRVAFGVTDDENDVVMLDSTVDLVPGQVAIIRRNGIHFTRENWTSDSNILEVWMDNNGTHYPIWNQIGVTQTTPSFNIAIPYAGNVLTTATSDTQQLTCRLWTEGSFRNAHPWYWTVNYEVADISFAFQKLGFFGHENEPSRVTAQIAIPSIGQDEIAVQQNAFYVPVGYFHAYIEDNITDGEGYQGWVRKIAAAEINDQFIWQYFWRDSVYNTYTPSASDSEPDEPVMQNLFPIVIDANHRFEVAHEDGPSAPVPLARFISSYYYNTIKMPGF